MNDDKGKFAMSVGVSFDKTHCDKIFLKLCSSRLVKLSLKILIFSPFDPMNHCDSHSSVISGALASSQAVVS